jgi:hypothetical protein
MTQISPTIPPAEERRPLPAWISIILIVLCLGGGGWIMHWYLMGDPISHESTLLDPSKAAPIQRNFRNGNGTPVDQPSVRQVDDSHWVVRVPEATMQVQQFAGKPASIQSLIYNVPDFVPQDQRNRLFAARRLVRDNAAASAIGLSEDQIKRLRDLRSAIGMTTEPADLDKLKELWKQYQTATDKQSAEGDLFTGLTVIARKDVDATRDTVTDRANKIKAVLTDDQWKKFEAMGR